MKEESWKSCLTSVQTEAEVLGDLLEYLDKDAFGKAVDRLASCSRIMTCASGTSGIAAKKFAHSLCCIERGACFMPPCEAVHGGLGALKKEDVLIMVSRGGKTAELFPVADVCRKKGAYFIVVTENLDSPLAKAADLVLKLRIRKESDPVGLMATSSFIATIGLFDALLSALITETGYVREQFGLIHPGGAVGALLKEEAANV